MEIQVGEYIRTKNGYIRKIVEKREDLDEYCFIVDVPYFNEIIEENTLGIYSKEDVVKHSFNIIDLLQKGDFVNGYEVDDFDGYDEEGNYFENDLGIPIYDDANMDCIVEYRPIRLMKIKSIVTKEQFQAMQYVIKEE